MTLLNMQSPHFARIEQLAREHGFADPDDYILALIEDDVDEDEDPAAGFRRGWLDVIEGRFFSVDDIKRRAKQNEAGSSSGR